MQPKPELKLKLYLGAKSVCDLVDTEKPEVGKEYIDPNTKQGYRVQSAHEEKPKVWRVQVTEC